MNAPLILALTALCTRTPTRVNVNAAIIQVCLNARETNLGIAARTLSASKYYHSKTPQKVYHANCSVLSENSAVVIL